MNLKDTLNLPKTAFGMRLDKAVEKSLTPAETEFVAFREKDAFILHDGPPFANGDIHLGHAINKVVKDITNRAKQMEGFYTPFRPGWDCHGLPIENQVKETVDTSDVVAFRNACRDHAGAWLNYQREQFKRLGVQGIWADPYATFFPDYEAATLRVFARLVELGLVYRKNKPVHWSIENQTALAVGELEYKEVESKSIYVGFQQYTSWESSKGTQFLAWTTTPWTLPANQALAINKNAMYVRIETGDRKLILAEERAAALFPDHKVLERIEGRYLLGMKYIPLFDQWDGRTLVDTLDIYHGDFVSTKTGTGIVHIAPSHGMDDFGLCEKNGIYPRTPVAKDGRFTQLGLRLVELHGKNIWDANEEIARVLSERGQLHGVELIKHEYPHDWRSGKPTIQLATPQWFVALDKPFGSGGSLRERAVAECENIKFVPDSGKSRFVSMLKNRPDWCISRQRFWGLPIPAFYDKSDEPLLTHQSVEMVASHTAVYGSSSWYINDPHLIIEDPFRRKLKKEVDTFDVWFESGASWTQMPMFAKQADVYIEGTDQHRGWFQHSLLLGVAVSGHSPFKTVVTHGFVVKPDGTKVSKSDPEYVRATEIMDQVGIDPLRLWIASNDFQRDICASPKMIQDFVPKYDKVRNTLRFLIGNLADFDPNTDAITTVPAQSVDAWLLHKLMELAAAYFDAMREFAYHKAVAALVNFINIDLSAIYANFAKDRLYCGGKMHDRRRCQTVLSRVLHALLRLFEPFIPMTVAEARGQMPSGCVEKVSYAADPEGWKVLFKLREDAIGRLDDLKKTVGLTKATDARAVYILSDEHYSLLQPYGNDLADIVGCGSYILVQRGVDDPSTITIDDMREALPACERSWKRHPSVQKRNIQGQEFMLTDRDYLAVMGVALA